MSDENVTPTVHHLFDPWCYLLSQTKCCWGPQPHHLVPVPTVWGIWGVQTAALLGDAWTHSVWLHPQGSWCGSTMEHVLPMHFVYCYSSLLTSWRLWNENTIVFCSMMYCIVGMKIQWPYVSVCEYITWAGDLLPDGLGVNAHSGASHRWSMWPMIWDT